MPILFIFLFFVTIFEFVELKQEINNSGGRYVQSYGKFGMPNAFGVQKFDNDCALKCGNYKVCLLNVKQETCTSPNECNCTKFG